MPRARIVLAGCAAVLAAAPRAAAVPAPPPPAPRAALVGERGTVWSEGGALTTDAGFEMARGLVGPTPVGRNGWIAAEGESGLLAGPYASVLKPVAGGPKAAGGCAGWSPDTSRGARAPVSVNGRGMVTRTAAFAVTGRTLVLAGTPNCPSSPPSSARPIFFKTLPDGKWRTALRGTATGEIELDAAGQWLAVGFPAGSGMTADIFDRKGARRRYRVQGLKAGKLQIDSDGTLLNVVDSSTPTFPVPDPGLNLTRFRGSWATPTSPRPHPIAELSIVPPVLQSGRVALVTENPDGTGALIVKELRSGRAQAVAGTRPPHRQIRAVGLRGNALAWFQSETPVPPPRSCSFTFGQDTPAAHYGTDLSKHPPLLPAPDAPIPGVCGPPPP